MAEAVILELIQKLESWADLRILEIHWIPNADALKEIFDELRMMADFLRDEESVEEKRLNVLIGDVVEMVEDIVDLSEYDIMWTLANGIEFTRDWVRETRIRMISSGIDGFENVGEGDEGEEDVVGLEEDVKVLLRRAIFNEEKSLSTLLVKGMAGIGKTALARQVYEDAAVVGRFECRAWVCLSSGLTNKEVIIEIMRQVNGNSILEEMEDADNESLQQMVRQRLQGKAYFVVVDNVPKGMRYLKSVLKCLPEEDKGNRLMLTSRSWNYVVNVDYTHEMKALDSDKSWKLFVKTINKFTSDGEQYKFPKHLEKGKEMMTKACGGLPVAIIDVGRRKAKQRLEKGTEWEELLEIDSIDLNASLKLLESSYRELDEDLQARFVYVAFFKENTIIRAKKLEQIWVVVGGFDEPDTAMPCMYALARESFFEIVDESACNRIKHCRVNPLLHRLSIKIAEEELGFEILRNFYGDSNGANSRTSPSLHRVVHCGRDEFNHDSTVNQDEHLVSLIFRGGGSSLDDANWKRFEMLNMLDLEDFGLKILSERIGTTVMEPKYLGLRNNYIQEIPRSLGCLKKLEALDISQNFMIEVPDIIWEMSGLKHLHMSDAICPKPLKIDTLEHLETLAYVSVDDVLGLETTTMTNLERLGIEEVDENSDVSKLFESLAELENFSRLTLRGFRFRSMPCLDEVCVLDNLRTLKLDGLLARLPTADNFPPNIKELSLVNSRLDEDPMPVLEKLPYLIHLTLWNAYTGRQMVICQEGFPNLEVLCIKELWNLRNLNVAQVVEGEFLVFDMDRGVRVAGMEKLNRLEIDNCPYLDTLPEEIRSIKHLKELKMVTTKKIATKIRKSGLISRISKTIGVDLSP